MKGITILHLSDIHFQKREDEENRTYRQGVQAKLLEVVKAHLKKHKNLDFVVVTGDIAFSGKKQQYDEAWDFFKKLKTILPGEIPFLPVPGNHDVDRKKVKKHFSLHRIVNEDEIDSLLEDEQDIKNVINVKFKAFRKFSDQLHPDLYKPKDDYFWVKNVEAKGVSFLGLNSAWASENENDRFNIALGGPQVAEALERSKKKWQTGCS